MKKLLILVVTCLLATNLLATPIKKKFVTVDGTQFWTEQYGQGKPTLILINGTGKNINTWNGFIPSLTKLGTVFAYDRAGLGKSVPLKNQVAPRSAKFIVKRMRGVLQAANIHPPYVLVADAIGTLYARYFARTFPNDVKGLVLINPVVNAAIALGEINDPKEGHSVAQALFRQQYSQNFHNLRQSHLLLIKSHRYQISQTQAARIENYLELLGESKSERQIIAAAPLLSIPMVIIDGKQRSSLETAMLKQIAGQTPNGRYHHLAYDGDDIEKISPTELVVAVKRALSK